MDNSYSLFKLLLNKILIFVSLIITVLLFIFVGINWALGFMAGVVVMLLNWKLLAWQNEKIIKKEKKPSYAYIFYFFRYALIAVVLYLSFYYENIKGYGTIIGILFSLVFIFVFAYFMNKKERGQ